jgi:hypothetical protein
MAWRVPADPRRFSEAVEWFRRRVPISKRKFNSLRTKNRRRAFTVSGTNQLQVVTTIFDELDRSIDQGIGLDEFKRNVRKKLKSRWREPDSAYLETVFRTNVQSALNAGRFVQLNEPDVLASRPYRMLDVVFDARTSDICLAFDDPPFIRLATDPIWATHWPPFHHRCRTGVRGLTRKQAERYGILKKLPSPDIPEGFGLAPDVDTEWSPDPKDYPSELFNVYKRRQAARRKRKRKVNRGT